MINTTDWLFGCIWRSMNPIKKVFCREKSTILFWLSWMIFWRSAANSKMFILRESSLISYSYSTTLMRPTRRYILTLSSRETRCIHLWTIGKQLFLRQSRMSFDWTWNSHATHQKAPNIYLWCSANWPCSATKWSSWEFPAVMSSNVYSCSRNYMNFQKIRKRIWVRQSIFLCCLTHKLWKKRKTIWNMDW